MLTEPNPLHEDRRTNIPDAIPGPDVKGHARSWADGAILGCASVDLPNGQKY